LKAIKEQRMKVTTHPPLQHEQKTLLESFCRTTPLDSEEGEVADRMARSDIVTFTKQLLQHICTGKEMMSTAAALLGNHLRLLLGQRTDQGVAT
jgi:hypothetical protein